MLWIAAALALAALLVARHNVSPATKPPEEPPDVPLSTRGGVALFWAHKTKAGFECLGWCDEAEVVTVGSETGYRLRSCHILDLNQPSGIFFKPEIWLTLPEVKHQSVTPGGFHFLYHLIDAGFLMSRAAAYLWPDDDRGQTSLEIRRKIEREAKARHAEGAKWSLALILSKLPGFVVDFLNEGKSEAVRNFLKRGAAGSLLYPRATPYYFSVRSVPWNNFWSGSAWPVGVELSPGAFELPVGDR